MERPSDEEILKFEREIKSQETQNTPLVSTILNFDHLTTEYSQSPVFLQKIKSLEQTCTQMRTVKKDGNCFYRAFAFRFCELAREQNDSPWGKYIIKKAIDVKNILTKMGYDMSILDDFYDPFHEALTNLETNLLDMFTTEYTSDTIVCFLRILTAAFLKSERETYEMFIMDSYPSLDLFIGAQVEPMNVESDQIHIVAMANALGVAVKVANLDQSGDKECNFHEITPIDGFQGVQPMVGLLYRPGHYDIIYIK